jgi:hypothetical protein
MNNQRIKMRTLVLSIIGAVTAFSLGAHLNNEFKQQKTIPEPYRSDLYVTCISAHNTVAICSCIEGAIAESGAFNPPDLSPEVIEKINAVIKQAMQDCKKSMVVSK